MSAVELEFVEAAVVPEDENCNFIYDQIRLNLSKMNQIGLNRISHLSKNVTINIFHLYPEDKLGYFFLDHTWIKSVQNGPKDQICPKWSKMVQNGPKWSKMVQNG